MDHTDFKAPFHAPKPIVARARKRPCPNANFDTLDAGENRSLYSRMIKSAIPSTEFTSKFDLNSTNGIIKRKKPRTNDLPYHEKTHETKRPTPNTSARKNGAKKNKRMEPGDPA
jgi:hypothetical protein